jgi:hypothetical protein
LIQNKSGYGQKKPAGIQLLHNEIAKLREDSTIRALPDVIGYWELLRNAITSFSASVYPLSIGIIHSKNPLLAELSFPSENLQFGDFPALLHRAQGPTEGAFETHIVRYDLPRIFLPRTMRPDALKG